MKWGVGLIQQLCSGSEHKIIAPKKTRQSYARAMRSLNTAQLEIRFMSNYYFICTNESIIPSHITVSYTHLDVYKRQVCISTPFCRHRSPVLVSETISPDDLCIQGLHLTV